MAGYNVIADISETLQAAITAAMAAIVPDEPPEAVVHDYSTDPRTVPASMVLFLYEISQDAVTRNRPRVPVQRDGVGIVLRKAPLTLSLRYLVTPFGGSRETEQRMLARTMQALYDEPILVGPALRGDELRGSNTAIKLNLAMLTLEERTRIWHSIQRPYRLSVVYEARLAEVDSQIETQPSLVRTRLLDLAEPLP